MIADCQAEVYQAEQLLKETMEAKKAGDRWWWFIDVTGFLVCLQRANLNITV